MNLWVEKRYLKIPVRHDGVPSKFLISEDGKPVYGFAAAYTPDKPDAVYYADLRNYIGKAVALDTESSCGFSAEFTDEMPPLADAETVLRPAVHFTAERGWINDPNGLCRYNGQYHLFYQHNPYGRLWGNMHWGHAVSDDLFHWEHREEALFSDMHGAMFSGSAVVDYENISGLKHGDDAPLLFFYTCAGEQESTQCLAYSTDGGKTLVKYGKNPLIAQIAGGNRDPKVIYDKERARWLMALYFEARTYALFTSQNLLDWSLLQKFDLPGDDECPDFYPLTANDGRTLWIFSGAHDMYFVGDFDAKGLYQPIQSVGQLSYNSQAYAAQTYYYEAGKPVVRFAWNRSDIPGAPFNGSMCTPTEMTLRKIGERYYLCALPVSGFEQLAKNERTERGLSVRHYERPLSSAACRISMSVKGNSFTCSLYGLDIRVERAGVSCKDAFLPRTEEVTMQLQIVCDTTSTELYLNGAAITAVAHVLDRSKPTLVIDAEKAVEIDSLHIAELSL